MGEFSKLKKIYWAIIIIPFVIYIPALAEGEIGVFFFGFLFVFLILYFGWLNRRSKNRLGYPFGDIWKVRKEISSFFSTRRSLKKNTKQILFTFYYSGKMFSIFLMTV